MTEPKKPEPRDDVARELLDRVDREDDGLALEFDRHGNVLRDTTPNAGRRYIALVRKDPESSFGVEFPDFPGCISAGDTLDEAVRGAAEALALHVEGITEDGQDLPEPSRLERLDTSGAIVRLVALAE